MKRRYIWGLLSVGLVIMTGCGGNHSMETNQELSWTCTADEAETKMEEAEETAEDKTGESGGIQESGEAEEPSAGEEIKTPSLLGFLQTALLPVGNTMYVWGGGWNEADTGAGPGAVNIGVLPTWSEFAALQDKDYNYKEHRYEVENGLDCSGYVGWAVYNLFEQEDGKEGYVYSSTDTAAKYSEAGWGELWENPTEFLPGDIVSRKGHVWISLGMCEDGSVVVLHSSPPGISICGTAGKNGDKSQAVLLAEQYMEKYYPAWQEKYPNRQVGEKYLTDVWVMRWKKEILADAEVIQEMSAAQVLKRLFEE